VDQTPDLVEHNLEEVGHNLEEVGHNLEEVDLLEARHSPEVAEHNLEEVLDLLKDSPEVAERSPKVLPLPLESTRIHCLERTTVVVVKMGADRFPLAAHKFAGHHMVLDCLWSFEKRLYHSEELRCSSPIVAGSNFVLDRSLAVRCP
jgi:hypothetical protein